jgi:HPr kinase/phosphorylase
LWHSLEVVGAPEVVDVLASWLPDAEHPMPPSRAMHYTAARTGRGYEVLEDGEVLSVVDTAAAASDAIHVRAHRRAFELASLGGWVRVHAATVDVDETRVLIAGPSGAGKTTFAARLLLDGADVEGDESVLVRKGESLAVPRSMHLKAGYERWLPELAPIAATLPTIGDVTMLDPARIGRPWRLHTRQVRHVVVLEPAGGDAPVECRPADGGAILEALLIDAFPLVETKSRMVATLAGAIVTARGHRLTVGHPDAMVESLRAAVR